MDQREISGTIRDAASIPDPDGTAGVKFAPFVIDFAVEKEKRERERRKKKTAEVYAAVAMLTDDQIEAAVYLVDPQDAGKLDVARFFLQELAKRDERRALDVFRRWKYGENM